VYPGRFPAQPGLFSIATLAEEIALIAGLDHSCDRKTGLYVELKAPNWHMSQNMDIAAVTLDILAQAGYDQRPEQVFVQCFDDHTLRRLRQEFATELPLIQLIAENSRGEDSEVDYDYLRTWEGTAAVAEYADGIGPHLSQVYLGRDPQGEIIVSDLVQMAHQHNLLVHPYTFRRDELPEGVQSFNDLLALFIDTLNVDGLFTDFPDTVVHYLQRGKLHK
jgi:glycerophosphoryl diester phosphodiesterase